MYHGTVSDTVFTVFENDGRAHWVSTDKEYTKKYSEGYFGNDTERASQLFTEPESGIYELYIKSGTVLDVGNISQEIQSPSDIITFGKSVGFSEKEIMQCWNSGRETESKQIWSMTYTPEFAKIARKHGYDSLKAVEDSNIIKYGILYPENIKSAKLETYDDFGKLIPLEKRFTTKKDIRYSFKMEDVLRQNETLKKAYVMVNNELWQLKHSKNTYKKEKIVKAARAILNEFDFAYDNEILYLEKYQS